MAPRWIFLIAGTIGLSAPAMAQRNAIDIKVRLAGTTEWLEQVDYINTTNLDPALVEVAVFYERGTGYGFSGSVHNIVTENWGAGDIPMLLDRADSAQHPDGRQGRFNFGAQRQQAYTGGPDLNTLRIAAANNTQNATGGGISVKQNTPPASGSLFDASNPALGFRFDVLLVPRNLGTPNVYELLTPLNRIANFAVYATETSTSGTNVPLSSLVRDGATITTFWSVPSPGWPALGIVIGLYRLRRRVRLPE